jgi:hypothetical protein
MSIDEDMQKELAGLQADLAPLEAELAARKSHEDAQLALLAEEKAQLEARLTLATTTTQALEVRRVAAQAELEVFHPARATTRDKLVANLSAFGAVTMLALCALMWSPMAVGHVLQAGVEAQAVAGLVGAGAVFFWQKRRRAR